MLLQIPVLTDGCLPKAEMSRLGRKNMLMTDLKPVKDTSRVEEHAFPTVSVGPRQNVIR